METAYTRAWRVLDAGLPGAAAATTAATAAAAAASATAAEAAQKGDDMNDLVELRQQAAHTASEAALQAQNLVLQAPRCPRCSTPPQRTQSSTKPFTSSEVGNRLCTAPFSSTLAISSLTQSQLAFESLVRSCLVSASRPVQLRFHPFSPSARSLRANSISNCLFARV